MSEGREVTVKKEILEALGNLNSVTSLVQSASREIALESREAMKQSGNLKRITGQVAESMDEMSENADQISAAAVRVREISRENRENINVLSGEIRKFKVELAFSKTKIACPLYAAGR